MTAGADGVARPVRAVEDDLQRPRPLDRGPLALQEILVLLEIAGVRTDGNGFSPDGVPAANDGFFKPGFPGVGDLESFRGENLDPVVVIGIVGGGDHDPGREAMLLGQKRHAGSGDDPRRNGAPPASRMPWTSACSIQMPDSRVSRPIRIFGARRSSRRRATRAAPKAWMDRVVQGILAGHRADSVRPEESFHERRPSLPDPYFAERTTFILALVWAVVKRSSGLGRMRSASNSVV